MPDHYVSHLGNGSAPTTGMAGAHQTQEAARAAAVAGDRILVAHDHDDTIYGVDTDLIYASTALVAIPIEVVDRTTLAKRNGTGRNIATASGFDVTLRGPTNVGVLAIDGIRAVIGGGNASTGVGELRLGTGFTRSIVKNLFVELPNSNGGFVLCSSAVTEIENIVMHCANPNGGLRAGTGEVIVRNSAPFAGSPVIPTQLVFQNTGGRYRWDHCDLSVFGAGRHYLGVMIAAINTRMDLVACRINSGCGIISGGVWSNRFNELTMRACIDEAGRIHNECHNASGSFTTDYSIFRIGGAQDVNGDPFSARLVSTAATHRYPVETFEVNFEVPVAKLGVPTTVTLHIVYDAATTNLNSLLSNDIWAEGMVHLASRPDTLTGVNLVNSIDVGAPLPASSATWSGTSGFTTPTTRALTFTFTPDREALHKFRVKLVKPNIAAGVYVCLSPDIS